MSMRHANDRAQSGSPWVWLVRCPAYYGGPSSNVFDVLDTADELRGAARDLVATLNGCASLAFSLPAPSPDFRGFSCGPAWIRTRDQRIMRSSLAGDPRCTGRS